MVRAFFHFFCLLLGLLPLLAGAADGSLVRLDSGSAPRYLDQGTLSMLRDPGGVLDIRQVADPARAQDFSALPGNLGAGYSRDVFWLRFSVQRDRGVGENWHLEVLPPYLDDVRLYEADGQGGFTERRVGDLQPFAAREIPYRGFVFRLQVPEVPVTYYLRLQSTSSIAGVLSLWPPDVHEAAMQREYLIFGLEKGLLLAAALFSLCAWVYVREPLHLHFSILALFQLAVGLTLHGFTAQYLLPGDSLWANNLTGILVGLGSAFAYFFFIELLDLQRTFPRLTAFYRLGIVFGLAAAASVPLGGYRGAAMALFLFSLVSGITLFWPCRERLRTGTLRARVEFFGLVLYLVSTTINLIGLLGIGPMKLWLLNGTQVATLAYLLLLEFGVHLRITEANRRHEIATQEMARERLIREDQGKFLAMLAHEIRTPLSIVSAALQSLQAMDPMPEQQRLRRYQRIDNAVRRMDATLYACLAEERMMQGHWLARIDPINLPDLSLAVMHDFSEEVRQRIIFDIAAALPVVEGDRAMLRVVLRNLMENAVKYAPGGEPIVIDIRPWKDGPSAGVLWRITDSGPGLEPGMAERIFEKYVRGSEHGGASGLGLGLYLSRRIVDHHGGWLRADEHCTQGASFMCWLPLLIPPSQKIGSL
jgi:signal transduction histidine kinase